jgi:hypothetical protein
MIGNAPQAVMNSGDLFPMMPGDAGYDPMASTMAPDAPTHYLDSEDNTRLLKRMHER